MDHKTLTTVAALVVLALAWLLVHMKARDGLLEGLAAWGVFICLGFASLGVLVLS